MNKSITVIGIIIVVVVIAAGAFVLMNGDSKDVHTDEKHVEFYGNGGLTSDGKKWIDSGMETAIPNMFTRDGYDFVSWNTQSNGNGTTVLPGEIVTMGMKLYAQWEQHVDRISTSLSVNGSTSYYDSITYVSGDKTYKYSEGPFYPKAGDYIAFTPSSDYSAVVYEDGFRAVKYIDNMCKGYFITASLTDKSGNELTLDLSVSNGVGKIAVPTDRSTSFSISVSFGLSSAAIFNSNSSSIDITCSATDYKTDDSGFKYYTARSSYSQNKFSWDGHYVKSWNTAKDGSGTSYSTNKLIPYADNDGTVQTVYAQWAQKLEYNFVVPEDSNCYFDLDYTFECNDKSTSFYKDLSPREELEITGPFKIAMGAYGSSCNSLTKVSDNVFTFDDTLYQKSYKLEMSYGGITPTSVTLSDDGKTVTIEFAQPSSDSVCSATFTFTKQTA